MRDRVDSTLYVFDKLTEQHTGNGYRPATPMERYNGCKDIIAGHMLNQLREMERLARCAGGTKRSRMEADVCLRILRYAYREMGFEEQAP